MSCWERAELAQAHQISREVLSTRERMLKIMEQLSQDGESGRYTPFEALFTLEEGRAGVVVTFMAILELAKEAMIEIVQNAPLPPSGAGRWGRGRIRAFGRGAGRCRLSIRRVCV